ncbi:histidine kinase [Pseudonocardiaceae bacterium YIM PH 21723]|nr:histidine kinase [Pseudonocardiaceae bacterium YIM PH 21723]
MGIQAPWWVAFLTSAFLIVFTAITVGQRVHALPAVVLVGTVLLAISSAVYWGITGRFVPAWKAVALTITAGVLMSTPMGLDFAPLLLIVLVTEMAGVWNARLAWAVAAASVLLVVGAGLVNGLPGWPIYLVMLLLGLTVGLGFRWYLRAAEAERGQQTVLRERAILDERQRIAREVHDVVAHSLSITLLHLTGARRALQRDADISEAVEGLAEAEQLARSAMTDIRRAVGLLHRAAPGTRPLPDVQDIAELAVRTRAAGVDVRYEQEGDLAEVGPAAGLGLYRIAQESLANIVKHAPDSVARMRLCAGADGIRLTVSNRLSASPPENRTGTGLVGMSDRAVQLGAQLSAGPTAGQWVVDVVVPR